MPTNGTENTSLIEYSNGASTMYLSSDWDEGRQLRKVRSMGRLCPVTLDTMNMGHNLASARLYNQRSPGIVRTDRMTQVPRTVYCLLRRVHEDGHPPTSGRLEYFDQSADRLFEDLRRCHVDLMSAVFASSAHLCHTDCYRHIESKGDSEMFLVVSHIPQGWLTLDIPINPAFPPTINMT